MAHESKSQGTGALRGFASMEQDKQREIARKGGANVPHEKRSFAQDRTLAAEAGAKAVVRSSPSIAALHRTGRWPWQRDARAARLRRADALVPTTTTTTAPTATAPDHSRQPMNSIQPRLGANGFSPLRSLKRMGTPGRSKAWRRLLVR